MIRVGNIKTPLDTNFEELMDIVIQKVGLKKADIKSFKIHKKSVDARDKRDVHFVYTVYIELNTDEYEVIRHCKYENISLVKSESIKATPKYDFKDSKRPVIVGSGPAGLFTALVLAKAGMEPIILERGKDIDRRTEDVNKFWTSGILNDDSNVQFGEGGAGTFSDGKLTTGIKGDISKIIDEFIEAGAPEEISYMSKPHIGTDRLKIVIKNIRSKIISMGAEFRFENKLEDLRIENKKLVGVEISDENGNVYEIETNKLILAIGHSARDTLEMLYSKGLNLIQKSFSIGARIEHSQKLIDRSQYGNFAGHPALNAAEYKMAVHLHNKKSVYTFCMCPGGYVVAAASEKGMLAVNGMSEYARNSRNANSALLVSVMPNEFGGRHPLQGMYLQREIEQLAFKAGGGNYKAPVQLVGDFIDNRYSVDLGKVIPSYKPGYKLTNLSECLPEFILQAMRETIQIMDKRLKGFADYDAVITGVETRSSSPVRIVRGDNFMANIEGIYPCGEGAGYAGGIMSAAADGIKCANSILSRFEVNEKSKIKIV